MKWGDLKPGDVIHQDDPELAATSWLLISVSKRNKLGYATLGWLNLDDGGIVPCRQLCTASIAGYRVESKT